MQAQFAKMREAQDTIRKSAIKKIEDILTKDQMIAFDKLLGKPFDFSTIKPGPGGRPQQKVAAPRDATQ